MQFAHPQEARDFLERHPEVRSIELMLIDANGIPRGKLLHRDELLAIYENGRPLPSSILSLTLQGEDVEASRRFVQQEDPRTVECHRGELRAPCPAAGQ